MESTRHCNHCCRELPIKPFRRYKRGQPQRRSECDDCRNLALRAKRAKKCRRAISKDCPAKPMHLTRPAARNPHAREGAFSSATGALHQSLKFGTD